MSKAVAQALQRLREQHRYRSRAIVDGPQTPETVIDGKRYISFCSNDYLGLANDARVIAAFQQGAAHYGVGSGASHLVTGHSRAHHELEESLAEFTGRPRALLFSTGYMANLGVVSALCGRQDNVFADRLNHASLLDAAQLAGAKLKRYAHNDVSMLAQLLGSADEKATGLVITDGVFSMDGDVAPLRELARLARAHDALLMVDDAHGFGVLGARGGGVCEQEQLNAADVPILMGTLGKAFGTFGAFVAGDDDLIDYLIQRARSYIYTTALPPAVACATLESLRIVREEHWRRTRLQELITRLREGATRLGVPLMPSHTPIQPLPVGDAARALALSEALARRGIYARAIRPPTVPQGTARLRLTLCALHTDAHVDSLLAALAAAWTHNG